jgi:hypothetical protein
MTAGTSPEGARAPWQGKTYEGTRSGPYGTAIIVHHPGAESYPLPWVDSRQFEADHYGTKLVPVNLENRTHEWGYGGSGPVATAASILADHFGGVAQPRPLAVSFKNDLIWPLPRDTRWVLAGEQVQAWVEAHADRFAEQWAEVSRREAEQVEIDRLQALEDSEAERG